MMDVEIVKVTDNYLMNWACGLTIDSVSDVDYRGLYRSEHSPIRTQMYCITILGLPTFVSTHLRTHSVGVTHFVKSLREDRCGKGDEGRWTPTNHGMFLNAQALINIARKRLCFKSHSVTRNLMIKIKQKMFYVDPELAEHLVPDCIYRGKCMEFKPCGKMGGGNDHL